MSIKKQGESSTDSQLSVGITPHNNGWVYDKMAATYSESYRHECEILFIVRMYREHGAEKVKGFLLRVERERGSDAASRLRYAAASHLGLGKKT